MSVAELRSAQAPQQDVPSADELIGRAKKLAPKLRERAVKAERDREIPQQSVDEYIESGLIHVLQPKRWGGYEHDHEVAFDIAVELGRSTCTSSAWVLNYLADHAAILAHFPEEAQHDVWSMHCHVGGADRQSHRGAGRIPARRPLVVVQRAAAFAMDHDRRACLP
jgi:alkylation response protein AidB-like acyl-CoA dehydrogenase